MSISLTADELRSYALHIALLTVSLVLSVSRTAWYLVPFGATAWSLAVCLLDQRAYFEKELSKFPLMMFPLQLFVVLFVLGSLAVLIRPM